MRIYIIITTIFISLTAVAQKTMTAEKYAEKYAPLAIMDMENYHIPASITLAQGIIESACGTSRLALEANNHFGIKCKSEWTGETILHDDDERGECFRKYSSVEDSYRDHSLFLSTRSRYASLFQLDIMDYKAWAKGLKAAGYATNPQYADNLIRIIENYRLYEYDKASLQTEKTEEKNTTAQTEVSNNITQTTPSPSAESGEINHTKFIIAHQGDSFTTLSFRTGISVKKLLFYNDLEHEITIDDGAVIYLGIKPKKSSTNYLHIIQTKSTTLYDVAQLYGISLKSLVRMNSHLKDCAVLPIGAEVRLR